MDCASSARWIPTGKLLNSCMGKVDSEPTHGSIVDIPHIHAGKQTLGLSAGLVLHQMTSAHNRSEPGIHDHINEPSSSKLVPKVVPLAVKTATSRQELELLFHHHIAMMRTTEMSINIDIGQTLGQYKIPVGFGRVSQVSCRVGPSSDLDAGSCTRAREVMIFCTIKGKPLALPWGRTPRLDSGVRRIKEIRIKLIEEEEEGLRWWVAAVVAAMVGVTLTNRDNIRVDIALTFWVDNVDPNLFSSCASVVRGGVEGPGGGGISSKIVNDG
ncbi:hypothetical protein Tco_0909959 [Tanacetum coccineum]|uniref:Uncharacterized protein n=1 Tax=Tanacetum coccineum TaxID=301880 RepID=A0ABQ5CXU1_9ASTR